MGSGGKVEWRKSREWRKDGEWRKASGEERRDE